MIEYLGKRYVLATLSLNQGRTTLVFQDEDIGEEVVQLVQDTLHTVKITKPLVLSITFGDNNGYDEKKRLISIGKRDFFNIDVEGKATTKNPIKFQANLTQLIGLAVWNLLLSKKLRKEYGRLVIDLPELLGSKGLPGLQKDIDGKIRKDFAIAFSKYWVGKLKRPRNLFMQAYINPKRKHQDGYGEQATKLNAPHRSPDRILPIPHDDRLAPDPAVPNRARKPPKVLLPPGTLNKQTRITPPIPSRSS